MRYATVCSGIEAPSMAWHQLGWRAAFFSEIEAFPCAVLAHHYPDVPNRGDMTKFREWPDAELDLICGGTPCQSFSVAGLRKGLDDPRGNLMLTYLAIVERYRPAWVVWENVPGVLSDKTGAFGALLGGLGQLGYGFAYRVLDAQYFGVPQRRRRVFVVGCFGDWRRAAAVLFERASLSGDPAPRRETREGIARPIAAGSARSSGYRNDADTADNLIAPEIARCITTREGTSQDWETTAMVAHSLRADGFDASEGGMGRGTPLVPVDVSPTLRAGGNRTGGDRPPGTDVDTADSLIPMTLAIRGRGDSYQLEYRQDGTANAILTPNGGRGGIGVGAVAFDTTQITSRENRCNPQPGDPCHPLAARAHAPTIAFKPGQSEAAGGTFVTEEYAPTLQAQNNGSTAVPAVAFDCKASGQNGFGVGDIASTQRAMGHAGSHTNGGGHRAVMTEMQVRRLTPRECERLQGFPDDFTLVPYRGKPAADGPRYKALGNSMAVPCMRWIGERIDMAMEAVA